MTAQKIKTYLWFNNNAEDAMNFYVSVFNDSKVLHVTRHPDHGVVVGEFQLEGQQFLALNGGPQFPFTEAVSLFVTCESQEEVDTLWEKLTANGGEPGRCGWLKDKFGLSWQIIPTALMQLIGDKDPRTGGSCDAGDAHDEQDRHRRSAAGLRCVNAGERIRGWRHGRESWRLPAIEGLI